MEKFSQKYLRKATNEDAARIWEILQQAIENRRVQGSRQWQDGYPNPETIANDIKENRGFVLQENDQIIAYSALIFNHEPAYENIEGKWLTNGTFLVVHRVALAKEFLGKRVGQQLFLLFEEIAKQNGVFSIKVDTNFDNLAMLKILKNLHYAYCGEVYFRGSARKAFEKVLH